MFEAPFSLLLFSMTEIMVHRLIHPWLHSDFIFKLSATGKRHDECLKVIHGFTNKVQ
jgi:hypothetical protein